MLSVIFEVRPHTEKWDAYLSNAEILRPELEQVPGFMDSILYRSLTREGWILSLTGWRDEKSVVRWRTLMRHHEVQGKAPGEILAAYQMRVGQVTFDTRIPGGCQILELRLDETEVGERTAITLIDAQQPPDWVNSHNAEEIALYLGFDLNSFGDCISWDVFDALLTPGSIILLASWKDAASALGFAQSAMVPDDARVRAVRVACDYGMFDRREAPQYYGTRRAERRSIVEEKRAASPIMDDEYLLQRFVDAQASIYEDAIRALRDRTLDPEWMAFIFPRFVNCYHDPSTEMFAIGSLDEGRAYLAHPLLGSRMRESLAALEWLYDLNPDEVLSQIDRQNLHSSLTLFAVATNESLMRNMLALWFGCRADETTIVQLDLRP